MMSQAVFISHNDALMLTEVDSCIMVEGHGAFKCQGTIEIC